MGLKKEKPMAIGNEAAIEIPIGNAAPGFIETHFALGFEYLSLAVQIANIPSIMDALNENKNSSIWLKGT